MPAKPPKFSTQLRARRPSLVHQLTGRDGSLHMPPPPPNQIILVNSPQGLTIQGLYDPLWISGELSTTVTENDMAVSAYSLKMIESEPYQ